jgi:hypothetical protein
MSTGQSLQELRASCARLGARRGPTVFPPNLYDQVQFGEGIDRRCVGPVCRNFTLTRWTHADARSAGTSHDRTHAGGLYRRSVNRSLAALRAATSARSRIVARQINHLEIPCDLRASVSPCFEAWSVTSIPSASKPPSPPPPPPSSLICHNKKECPNSSISS